MKSLNCLYEILATSLYNSERRYLFNHILKDFLISTKSEISMDESVKRFSHPKVENVSNILSGYFQEYDHILSPFLDEHEVLFYIAKRYLYYNDIFMKTYNISLEDFVKIVVELQLQYKKQAKNFTFPVFEFNDKDEYINQNFFSMPPDNYIKNYKDAFTIDINKFKSTVLDDKLKSAFDTFIKLYSIDFKDELQLNEFRIKEYPLILCDSNLILIDPAILIRYLPHKIHILLAELKSYISKKGLVFENLALNLLEQLPFAELLDRNINYDEYELDGLLNFRRSTWFVECKSRNISKDSLLGNSSKINKDIKKAIKESITQGERAINNVTNPSFNKYNIKRIKGILIITEGVFPTIQFPSHMIETPTDNSVYPVCILNYFELLKIMKQPDIHVFEDFLIWRSQKEMPILAFDAPDYWAFYNDNYRRNKEMKEAFKKMKEKKIFSPYISKRFNNKDYLNKIMKNN